MKRTVLLAALLICASAARAQVAIGPLDGLRAGDSIELYFIPDSLFSSVSIGTAIPGQTWNFSLPGWKSGFGGENLSVVGAQRLPDDSAFADATLALLEVREMPEFGTHDETYTYLGVSDDRLTELGTHVRFDVGQGSRREYTIIERNQGYSRPLPMRFGDHWINTYRTMLVRTPADTMLPATPLLAGITQSSVTSDVDGWGTVATPHGAYKALRVHSLSVSIDSLYNEQGEYTQTLRDTLETYDWFTPATGAYLPVVSVEVDHDTVASIQVMRYTSNSALVAQSPGADDEPQIFLGDGSPNPASSTVTIPFAVRTGNRVSMAIYDMQGNMVRQPLAAVLMEQEGSNVAIDLSDLPQGSYICRLEAEGRSVSRSIVVRR